MSVRIATRDDIPELQITRSSVTENVLTSIITEDIIIDVMEKYGRIWIYDGEGQAAGFSAAETELSRESLPGEEGAPIHSICGAAGD